MQVELKSLQREVGISFIFVTHDQEEAMVMSDRIALLRSGELEQVATPREIYGRPATAYAAQFIGHTNLLKGEVRAGNGALRSADVAGRRFRMVRLCFRCDRRISGWPLRIWRVQAACGFAEEFATRHFMERRS